MGEGLWGSAAPCTGTVGGQTKPNVSFVPHRCTSTSTHDSVYKKRMGLPPSTTVVDRMLSWFQTCCGGRNHGTGAGVEHTTNRLDTGDGGGRGRLAARSRPPHHPSG